MLKKEPTIEEKSNLEPDFSDPSGMTAAEVANRMADAVAYLSRVADDAGLQSISADLLLIYGKLSRFALYESFEDEPLRSVPDWPKDHH